MDFLEKDLESILYETESSLLRDRGLYCLNYNNIFRQVNLGAYGIADLITVRLFNKHIDIKVFELKNKILNPSAFWQTVRYIRGVSHVMSKIDLHNHTYNIRGCMIGRQIETDSDFCFLPIINSDIDIFTYSYDFNGINFNLLLDSYIKTGFKGIDTNQFNVDSGREFLRSYFVNYISENINING